MAQKSQEFLTQSGIIVSISHADVTSVPTSCIACSVDTDFSIREKTSEAIYSATGPELKADCSLFKTRMKLKVAQVQSSNGEPRWRKVLLVRSPSWTDFREDGYIKLLTDTVYECLREAEELHLESIAIPYFISEAAQTEELNACYTSYEKAISQFDGEDNTARNLKMIIIVGTADKSTGLQQRLSEKFTTNQTLRLILMGKSGVGKSCTGNCILRNNGFNCEFSQAPVTSTCSRQISESLDVEVVDTPGLFDQTGDKEDMRKKEREVMKSIAHCLPGPHAFLLVFRADDKYAEYKETDLCKRFQDLFSDPKETKTNVFDFTIVVLTHVKSGGDLKNLLQKAPQGLKQLIKKCKDRVVHLDNPEITDKMSAATTAAEYSKEREDIQKLIQTAKELRQHNGGQSAVFSNDITSRCLQLLQSPQREDWSVEQIKKVSLKESGSWCSIL